jgi:site-specific DNA recombinase
MVAGGRHPRQIPNRFAGDSLTSMTMLGREYARVSQDRSGRARSISEQHGDNVRAGETLGFTLAGDPYEDVSISASRYGRKTRDDFLRLLADLESGRFGADLLVLWESSRGSRKVSEWARLVELCEAAGVRVAVTTHSRIYDCANARDRRTLLEDAVDAAFQSDKRSDAIRRAAAATAARGEPHGVCPFGYARRYDERTRRLIAQEPEPAEAKVVRELFTRLRAGHSLRSISRDWKARGVTTRAGQPFDSRQLRDMALRPAYGGLRTHQPTGGKRDKTSLDGATEAVWPPLVPMEDFYAVRRC